MVIPEVDRGEWFGLEGARRMLREEQRVYLDALQDRLAVAAQQ
jgi:predicted NUDIX family NTP pyrophosphohydrolase